MANSGCHLDFIWNQLEHKQLGMDEEILSLPLLYEYLVLPFNLFYPSSLSFQYKRELKLANYIHQLDVCYAVRAGFELPAPSPSLQFTAFFYGFMNLFSSDPSHFEVH